ncbi:MAG: tRNA (adenosine(37)-N6)-dimethylallyltransferase MiaA [Microgenomates group bacterium]|jgi:tRNA dimethylallyltransferase
MKKVLVILGPTATGKTDLALDLAKKLNGELVSCDSRQVYKGLDIGTGKMPGKDLGFKKYDLRWEIDGTDVWMYDVADFKTQYTVKDYVNQAEKVIEDIINRNKLPIIVGGTGLYLKALLEGLPNLQIPVDEKLRMELEKLPLNELQEKLQSLSPVIWKKLNESDQKNPRRLLRSIELILMNPYIKTTQKKVGIKAKYEILKIGLTAPREILKKRIFDRLLSRFKNGLVKESITLNKKGLTFKRMKSLGLEYGMLAELLQKKISEEQFLQILNTKIYQYSKRQLTWFKTDKNILWFDITGKNSRQELEKQIQKWYY